MIIIFAVVFNCTFWGSSYIEYKLIKQFDWARRNFHGWKGMLMSLIISGTIGLITGGPTGVIGGAAAISATILGLATNDATFSLFENLGKANAKVKDARSWVAAHPQKVQDIAVGGKGLFALLLSICNVIGKTIRYTGVAMGIIAHPVEKFRKVRVDHRLPWEKVST